MNYGTIERVQAEHSGSNRRKAREARGGRCDVGLKMAFCIGLALISLRAGAEPEGGVGAVSAETPPSAPAADSQPTDVPRKGIDEIVVTAERRAETLQNVPMSITALAGEDLRAAGVLDTRALEFQTPSLSVSSNGPAGSLYLRGIGSDQLGVGSEGSTSIYLDDVYLGRQQNALSTLLDVQRVEVLRGPQGTLYGRNSVGGAIKIVSAVPTSDSFAKVGLSVGNYDAAGVEAVINGPIVPDKLMGRVAALWDYHEGYVKDINPAATRRLDDGNILRLRASTRYLPSDDLTVDLSADYSKDRGTGPVSKVLTAGTANALGARLIPDPYTVNFNIQNARVVEDWGLTSNVAWDLGALSLRSITGYRRNRWSEDIDSDGTEVPQQEVVWAERQQQFSQELQLTSAASEKFDWIGGLYYFYESSHFDVALLRPLDPALFAIRLPSQNKTNAFAVFTDGTYHVTDRFRVKGGLRYSYEKKDDDVSLLLNDGILGGQFPGNAAWQAVTPQAVLEYQAAARTLLYASVTRGFKSGGFNSVGSGEKFDPEYLWSYEVGMKSQWLDNLLQVNADSFYYNYRNLQVTRWIDNLTQIQNAARARVVGGELEVVALPTAGLNISLGLSLLNAEYTDYVTSNPATINEPPSNLAGNKLRNAPGVTANIAAEYTHRVPLGGALTWRLDYHWQSRVFFDPFNQPMVQQEPYGIAGARVTYASPTDRIHVSAFGKNIFNREYFTTVFRFDSTGYNYLAQVGEPRTYGVRVDLRY